MSSDILLVAAICIGVLNLLIAGQCFVIWLLRAIDNGEQDPLPPSQPHVPPAHRHLLDAERPDPRKRKRRRCD